MNLIRKYEVSGFWSVFSNDDRYVALQTNKSNVIDDENITVAIEIYDIKKNELVKFINLSEYKQRGLWLSDWIEK